MKTKPILFSTPMIKAILDGSKTQTRRIMNDQPQNNLLYCGTGKKYWAENPDDLSAKYYKCPYEIGQILWVRETWRIVRWNVGDPFKIQFKDGSVINNIYLNEERAIDYNIQSTDQCIDAGLTSNHDCFFHFDLKDCPTKWRPSIFMPKEAARIFLKVINVRVERLHDISESDAIAEGIIIEKTPFIEPANAFASLWQSINGKKSWAQNPFVWVYEFERTEKPENFI